jgi:hypothetical protein
MPKSDYIPTRDNDFLVWHDQFSSGVAAQAATFGLTPADTDQTGGVVQLQFSKSASDGVNIYSKRDNDADYVFLSRDTSSPYVDNRPLLAAGKPEMRHYKAIYIQNDVEVGNFSDDVIVACQP